MEFIRKTERRIEKKKKVFYYILTNFVNYVNLEVSFDLVIEVYDEKYSP